VQQIAAGDNWLDWLYRMLNSWLHLRSQGIKSEWSLFGDMFSQDFTTAQNEVICEKCTT